MCYKSVVPCAAYMRVGSQRHSGSAACLCALGLRLGLWLLLERGGRLSRNCTRFDLLARCEV